MSNIFYIISILTVGILFLIIKRQNKKIDLIPQICIMFLCILAYQTLECIILSYINISISLNILSIINLIAIFLLTIVIKKKGIQSFKIEKKDFLAIIILLVLVSTISYYDVGKIEDIRYYSTDASIHYIAAKEFYQNDKLLYKTEGTETSGQMMPIAYTNVGLIFKTLEPIIGEMNFYRAFILFDIIIFLASAILFYFIIKNKMNTKIDFLIGIVVTIIYMLGYPLNNLLSGFYYLGIGCLAINGILYVLKQKENKNIVTLSLLNVTLILSYSLFAPVVYLSMFIYYLIITRKKYNKIFNKEFIINTIVTLILPGIIGVLYLIVPNVNVIKCITLDGYINKKLLVNILFFIPFVTYLLFKKIKEKDINYEIIYFIILIIYVLISFLMTKQKIFSQYYFYKVAYILWAITIILFFDGFIEFTDKYKKQKDIANVYLIVYVILALVTLTTNKYILSIYNIYEDNIELINTEKNLDNQEIKMLAYLYDNNIISQTENNVLFIQDFMGEAWIRSMFKYRNRYPLEKNNYYEYIEKWNNGETDYLVVFEDSQIYKAFKKYINLKNSKLIYTTENSKFYVYNK